jgi:EmrB/QacA subfamily drug resistance transporter
VWVVASVVVVGAIMSILDTTIVNVALRTLAGDLHASLSEIQYVITGYLLALATVIPPSGWAVERFGAKRVWMTAVVVFVIGSVLSGTAWSADSLIGFRVLQGFGGGMIMPVGISVLAQTAGPQRMGRVMAVIGVPLLLGPVLGPVLGGLLVQVTWRLIFFVNVPIGVVALILAYRIMPSSRAVGRGSLDLRGLMVLSPGVALVVYGLSEAASAGGFGTPQVWAPIVGGIGLVAAFVVHARHASNPLIDVRLFSDRGLAAASVSVFALGAALFGALLVLPLYYQVARGESPLHTGLLLVPQGIGAALAMPMAGRLTDRIGGGRVALGGLAFMLGGTAVLTQVGAHTSYVLLTAILVVRGFGLAGTMMPTMASAYATLQRDAVPRATSALNVIQRVGGSIGTAALAVFLHSQLPGGGGIGATRAPPPGALEAIAHAFGNTFWLAFGLSAVAVIPTFVLARVERHAPPGERSADGA